MNAIVAVCNTWGIGCGGDLLHRIPGDMAFFRRTTRGKIVVMGRKTLNSLPGGRPLPDRKNIVLSRNPAFSAPGVITVHSLDQLRQVLAPCNTDEVYVMGGGDIYDLLLPYCKTAYVTHYETPGLLEPDAFFPDISAMPEWALAERSPEEQEEETCYTFCRYVNSAPKAL